MAPQPQAKGGAERGIKEIFECFYWDMHILGMDSWGETNSPTLFPKAQKNFQVPLAIGAQVGCSGPVWGHFVRGGGGGGVGTADSCTSIKKRRRVA